MIYSNSSTKQGLVELIRRLTNTDTNTYPIADLTSDFNTIYSEYVSLILSSDTRWEWDDSNYTTLPIATTDLNVNQRDYQFNDTFLKIIKVLVKQDNGEYYEIQEIDSQDSISSQDALAMDVDSTTNVGQPTKFNLFGDTIRLQPIPNYSETAGLKVYYQRYEDPFVSTDTTKQPGIPQPYHIGLAYGTAHLFALAHNQPNVDRLKLEDTEVRKSLREFLSKRNKAERPQITARYKNPQ